MYNLFVCFFSTNATLKRSDTQNRRQRGKKNSYVNDRGCPAADQSEMTMSFLLERGPNLAASVCGRSRETSSIRWQRSRGSKFKFNTHVRVFIYCSIRFSCECTLHFFCGFVVGSLLGTFSSFAAFEYIIPAEIHKSKHIIPRVEAW